MKTDTSNSLDDDDFTIYNREGVIGVLRDLVRAESKVSAVFNQGSEVMLTMVLGVDPDSNSVHLDTNINSDLTRRLIASDRVFFNSASGSATVKWASTQVQHSEFKNYKTLRVPIPDSLQKIQRRGVYRVATPIVNPILCRIPLPENRSADLPLVDICIEGIGAVLPETDNEIFQRGVEFKKCLLMLPEVGNLEFTLVVQAVWEVLKANGTSSKRAGFLFGGIKPREQAVLQRFILKLDSVRAANRRGQ